MSIAETNAASPMLQNASTLKSEERRERMTFFGLSLPAVLAILIVVFVPVFWLSSLSFYNAAGELSLENYERIFNSALYRRTFVVTFQISISVTVICVFMGYPLCYWLTKSVGQNSRHSDGLRAGPVLDFGSGAYIRLAGAIAAQWHHKFVVDVDGHYRGTAATGAQPYGFNHRYGTYYAAVSDPTTLRDHAER